MKLNRLLAAALILAAALLTLPQALGETARVVTRGGALNLRKTAEDSGKLLEQIPPQSLVEVLEEGETWSLVTYKKKTGYVKSAYLKIPSHMIGQSVYGDNGALLLRKEPDAASPLVYPVSAISAVTVLAVDGDWARVSRDGFVGFVPLSELSYQYAEPAAAATWMNERGYVLADCDMNDAADGKGSVIGHLSAGQAVIVTMVSKEWCLAVTEDACGYVPAGSVCLLGPTDTPDRAENMSPLEAGNIAYAALNKKYSKFAKEHLYCLTAVLGEESGFAVPAYYCGYYNEADQYLYGALVDTATGKALLTAHYDAFAAPPRENALLPEGEVEVALSADSLAVGDVLDITVRAWTDHACQYALSLNGKSLFAPEAADHFSASFRPREAGEYLLTVTVTDESKRAVSKEVTFIVEGSDAPAGPAAVYSQKDGWWKDKVYRHSNLGKSGCAIFALSHALQRLGFTGDETLPENLAVKYAVCLTPGEGTNNERLIGTAAKDYGFKTRKTLYTDAGQIASFLQSGAMFSFSVARGHIAMISGISEDGSMVRVVDSAPGATFERIVNASLYYQMNGGGFREALRLEQIPGARWYLDTEDYGGLEYWMQLSYAAKRGVRLIQLVEE